MAKGKMKMLHLIRIFSQETDDEHALTLQEIITKLAAVNITADRKTLYNDFEDLRQFGFDIIAQQRDRTTYYHLGEREFELPELKLLVDSVQAAKFITTRKSRELIRKLERYTSIYQAAQLQRQVYIAGRVKAMNESIYYNIDRLHGAINAGIQIRFQYGQWNLNKEMELRRGGDWYQVSPWALTWDDEKYYLVAYDADADMIKHYRVDKMLRIKALDEPREGKKAFEAFDMALYSKSVFGMFTGEETTVTLEAENHMVGVIIDRFGKDINLAPVSDTHFQATVNVIASPQFIGWIVALGKSIRIVAPDALVERMREEIHRLSEQYNNK
ncbi:MAG: WYL domain-containing protein [Clostridia bacterium]|nr:WYL domain-containing protein [Clostridia bacterium]